MPLSYLKRPAFLWLVSYLALLCLLRAWGWFPKPPWRPPPPDPGGGLGAVRAAVLGSYQANLPAAQAAVLGGVVLGARSRLPRDLKRAFRDAGAIHLLVASGSNVAFALLLAAGAARLLGASRIGSMVAGLAAAAAYTACAGADAPLLRGFLMTAFGLGGFFLGRNPGALQGLTLACWALALWDPACVFSAGFQMSFAATFGLVAALPSWRPPRTWPSPLRYAAGVFLASLAAQVAIAPVIAVHFRQVSLTALLSNVLLVPLTGVLMAGGFALAVVDALLPSASVVPAGVLAFLLALFETLVRFFAALPLRWHAEPPGPAFLAAYYACALALWCRPSRSNVV